MRVETRLKAGDVAAVVVSADQSNFAWVSQSSGAVSAIATLGSVAAAAGNESTIVQVNSIHATAVAI